MATPSVGAGNMPWLPENPWVAGQFARTDKQIREEAIVHRCERCGNR